MTLSIIVAMSKNRVIGRDGKIPWHLSEDLKRFKQITMGHTIIMGRKTFESIGKTLPGRKNIVITRNPRFAPHGVTIAHSLNDAIREAGDDSEIFVIGGAEIFKEALPRASKLYLTLIERGFDGDAFFRDFDLTKDYEILEDSGLLESAKDSLPYRFVTALPRS
jgi:dihydrofolate reductase